MLNNSICSHFTVGFMHKCIQLYETTVVRHGLMLVGPTGSGKTKVLNAIRRTADLEFSSSLTRYARMQPYITGSLSVNMWPKMRKRDMKWRLADLDLTNQRSAQLRSISVSYIRAFWGENNNAEIMYRLCRNSSVNNKCTFFTFQDEQKQNTEQ